MEQIITNKYDSKMSQQALSDMLNIKLIMNELRILERTPNKDVYQKNRCEALRLQLHGLIGASN